MAVEALLPAVWPAADGKVLLVAGLVAFVLGLICGRTYKTTLRAALMAAIGVGFLLLGISMYAGGFTATKWSVYVYIGAGVVLGGASFWFQRSHFGVDYDVDETTGQKKGAFDGEEEGYTLGMDLNNE